VIPIVLTAWWNSADTSLVSHHHLSLLFLIVCLVSFGSVVVSSGSVVVSSYGTLRCVPWVLLDRFPMTVPTSTHVHSVVTWGRHLRGQATDQQCPDPGTLQSPLHVWDGSLPRVLGRAPRQRSSHSSGDPEAWSASHGTAGTLQSCPL